MSDPEAEPSVRSVEQERPLLQHVPTNQDAYSAAGRQNAHGLDLEEWSVRSERDLHIVKSNIGICLTRHRHQCRPCWMAPSRSMIMGARAVCEAPGSIRAVVASGSGTI